MSSPEQTSADDLMTILWYLVIRSPGLCASWDPHGSQTWPAWDGPLFKKGMTWLIRPRSQMVTRSYLCTLASNQFHLILWNLIARSLHDSRQAWKLRTIQMGVTCLPKKDQSFACLCLLRFPQFYRISSFLGVPSNGSLVHLPSPIVSPDRISEVKMAKKDDWNWFTIVFQ